MISVIIPYYNPSGDSLLEKLLTRSIYSAVFQSASSTYDIEVIVVDDGSSVPPRNAVSSFDGSQVHLIEAQHGRLGAARNRGIDAARGEIIAFLDADDYYFKDSLMPCVRALQETGADLLGFRFAMLHETDESIHDLEASDTGIRTECTTDITPKFRTPVSGRKYMAEHTPFGSSCMYLIRRSLLTDNNLRFAENTYMEDEDFTPRLLFFSRQFIESDAKVYAYCRREGSITTAPIYDERAANTLGVLRRLIAFREEHANELCDGLDRKIRFLAMDHIRRTLRRPDWKCALPMQTEALRELGLWPLIPASYGWKYRLFTFLIKGSAGIRILRLNERRYSL